MNDLDEAAWTTAGRLLLALHLEDERLGFMGYKKRWHEHRELAIYGYDMSACSCDVSGPATEVPPRRSRIDPRATSSL